MTEAGDGVSSKQTNDVSNNNNYYDPKEKKNSNNALPPWHAVTYVCIVTTISIHQCHQNIDTLDEVALVSTFTNRVFPQYVSLKMLGWIRACIALSIWIVFWTTITGPGWIQTTNYPKGSQLLSGIQIPMKGFRTLFPFTSWCWIMLGMSFTFHSILALAVAYYNNSNNSTTKDQEQEGIVWLQNKLQPHPWIVRSILLLWETTAPCAFLVSAVIRYAIWDMVKKGGPGRTLHLKHIRNIFSHNFNSVFVLMEVALLGGVPVRLSEMYLGPLLGCFYVIIAWSLSGFWVGPNQRHFLYFFLDTTLGYKTTMALIALTATLCFFYVLLAYAQGSLNELADIILLDDFPPLLLTCHVIFVVTIASLVCRFND